MASRMDFCCTPESCCPDQLSLCCNHSCQSFQAGGDQSHVIYASRSRGQTLLVKGTRCLDSSLGLPPLSLTSRAIRKYLAGAPISLNSARASSARERASVALPSTESELSRETEASSNPHLVAHLSGESKGFLEQRNDQLRIALGKIARLCQPAEHISHSLSCSQVAYILPGSPHTGPVPWHTRLVDWPYTPAS